MTTRIEALVSAQTCKTLFWLCLTLWALLAGGFMVCFSALTMGLVCDWVPGTCNVFRAIPDTWGRLLDLYAYIGLWPLAAAAPGLFVLSIVARHSAGLFAAGVDYHDCGEQA